MKQAIRPALSALFNVLEQMRLADGAKRALFVRAAPHPALERIALDQLIIDQTFRPAARVFEQRGMQLDSAQEERFDLILYLGTKSKLENLYQYARMIERLTPSGRLICSFENGLGAKTFEKYFRKLCPEIESISKQKCRVFWNTAPFDRDCPLLQQWSEQGNLQLLPELGLYSQPGLFSWNRIDRGSQVLAQNLPESLEGKGCDLGAGYGFLSIEVLRRMSESASLDLYEGEKLALNAARKNIGRVNPTQSVEYFWLDICAEPITQKYDWIVMNPPFHQEQTHRSDIGKRFIQAAAKSLQSNGTLYMVANVQLPYESQLRQHFSHVNHCAERDGYKICRATQPQSAPY